MIFDSFIILKILPSFKLQSKRKGIPQKKEGVFEDITVLRV